MKVRGEQNRPKHLLPHTPIGVFYATNTSRDLKLGTYLKVFNANSREFQGYAPIITPFTSPMCGIQGHYAENVVIQ